jgi:hypothetical protein
MMNKSSDHKDKNDLKIQIMWEMQYRETLNMLLSKESILEDISTRPSEHLTKGTMQEIALHCNHINRK